MQVASIAALRWVGLEAHYFVEQKRLCHRRGFGAEALYTGLVVVHLRCVDADEPQLFAQSAKGDVYAITVNNTIDSVGAIDTAARSPFKYDRVGIGEIIAPQSGPGQKDKRNHPKGGVGSSGHRLLL